LRLWHVSTHDWHQSAQIPSFTSHDSFICVPWLIHMCAMTHSYVCQDPFICAPWLIHMCAMALTHTYQEIDLRYQTFLRSLRRSDFKYSDLQITITFFEWQGLHLLRWKSIWNFGDSRENVFDMYGDSSENLLEIWGRNYFIYDFHRLWNFHTRAMAPGLPWLTHTCAFTHSWACRNSDALLHKRAAERSRYAYGHICRDIYTLHICMSLYVCLCICETYILYIYVRHIYCTCMYVSICMSVYMRDIHTLHIYSTDRLYIYV